MRSSDFMKAIPDAVRPHLPPASRDFQWHARAWLVQIHYGQPAVHYEVWSMQYRDLLELGLHFEQRDPAANARLLAYFDAHAIAIKAELGERVEVEPWIKVGPRCTRPGRWSRSNHPLWRRSPGGWRR